MSKHIHSKAPWDETKTACRKKITKDTWLEDHLDGITCPKCTEEMFDHLVGMANDELRTGIAHIKTAFTLYQEIPEINMVKGERALVTLLRQVISYSERRK